MRRACALLLVVAARFAIARQSLALPDGPASLKFVVIGDNGTGGGAQYGVGRQMAACHRLFPFEMVIMLGDNLHGRQERKGFVTKLEAPRRLTEGTV